MRACGSGLRSTLYTQFMPGSAYPLQEDFLRAVLADIAAMRSAA